MWIPPEKDHLHDYSRSPLSRASNRKWIYRALAVIVIVVIHWHYFPGSSVLPSSSSSATSSAFATSVGSSVSIRPSSSSISNGETQASDGAQFAKGKTEMLNQPFRKEQKPVLIRGPVEFSPDLKSFWHQFADVLIDNEPPIDLKDNGESAMVFRYGADDAPTERQNTLGLPQEDVDQLKAAHSNYTQSIVRLAKRLPFKKGSQGIVLTAGGDHLAELFVTLRILRNTGSKLPVEVFLENGDAYKPGVCEEILPLLNARCALFSDIIDGAEAKVNLQSFQFKAFAVLFSSFDEVLLLDADNLPLRRPEDLMQAEPFTTKGLVTWPDYWSGTVAPAFYDIASIDIPPDPNVRAASESGQMLLSKSKHAKTLLLAMYYNVYGVTHYYTLLCQHGAGQGDKETWLAAALALEAPFYDVKATLLTPGFRPNGPAAGSMDNYQGAGCIQRDPRDDANPFFTDIRPAFFHAQTYKLSVLSLPDKWFSEINGRMWGDEERGVELFYGRDLEKEAWQEMEWTACEVGQYLKEMEGKEVEVCETIKWIERELFESEGKKGKEGG